MIFVVVDHGLLLVLIYLLSLPVLGAFFFGLPLRTAPFIFSGTDPLMHGVVILLGCVVLDVEVVTADHDSLSRFDIFDEPVDHLLELCTLAVVVSQGADKRRRDYEETRADFVKRMAAETRNITGRVREFYDLVVAETDAFRKIMQEYGATRRDDQLGYSVQEGDFRLEVKCNRVKCFDERADVAAARLIDFLKAWIGGREKGADDPMYQLAMTLLERNRKGDLDYKSISKLYDLEAQFGDPEYSQIMQLFKESNVVNGTAINFYFHQRDERGVWHRIEPSFNRM